VWITSLVVETATTLSLENYTVETQLRQLNGVFSSARLAGRVTHSLWKTLWMTVTVRDYFTQRG